jgi:hypothetical protein
MELMTDSAGAREESQETVGTLLDRRRRAHFVGRERELDLFRSALASRAAGFSVLNVHGPGGIGKTALLDRFADLALAASARVVRLDGRDLAPTPAAILDAVDKVDHSNDGQLADRPDDRRLVLLLDTFEMLQPLDDWVRTDLVPRLPASAITVISGRHPLGISWREDPAWHDLLRVVPLRNLSPPESRSLLSVAGIEDRHHARLVEATHGHPLGLSLVTDVVGRGGEGVGTALPPDLVGALVQRFVEVVPSPVHRRVLEACAIARTTTEALVRDVVDADQAAELFSWLCDLSFIDTGPDGVFPHDLARDALEADLRWRDPEAFATVFRAVRDHVFVRLRAAQGREQQRALFDEKFLLRHQPDLMARLEWASFGAYYPEPARPDDLSTIIEIARDAEGAETVAYVQHWWDIQPEAFMVVRRPEGAVRGFSAIVELSRARPDEIAADPVAEAVWAHVQRQAPPRPGDVVSLSRFTIDQDAYQGPSPTLNLSVVLSIQHFLQEPRLASWFVCLSNPDDWDEYFTFSALPRVVGVDVDVAGRKVGFFGNDFRRVPVDQWLELLTERALARDFHPTTADARAAPLLVLSRPDFDDAVRHALRNLRRPDELSSSPLLRSALVRGGGDVDAATTLVAVIRSAVDRLRDDPRDDRLHRVLDRTFLRPAGTQERAAEVLDLPMSTYKRHLRRGIDRVTGFLWDQELSADSTPRT